MANTKKLIQAAAGNAGGAGLNVEEVFSTYLYDGTGSAQTITNDIDLSGEGGLVWIKRRSTTGNHQLWDTNRGVNYRLFTDGTQAQNDVTGNGLLTSFNANGFSLGSDGNVNGSGQTFASWTFRKAPKFFDVVTYTGTGSAGLTVSHNLGCEVGSIFVKRTDSTGPWQVYHRGVDPSSPEDYYLELNTTGARADNVSRWNDTAPTSTQFTLGTNHDVNQSGGSYVAYLFAHNDGDGEFGPDGDADIIKCGSYTGNGSTDGPEIDLGFEPQWLLVKNADSGQGWDLYDSMRGIPTGAAPVSLQPNDTYAEFTDENGADLTATGFKVQSSNAYCNASGETYIYMAIRRGPMAVPESGTDVFAPAVQGQSPTDPTWVSNFVTDWVFTKQLFGSNTRTGARLTAKGDMNINETNLEGTYSDGTWDFMDGYGKEDNQTDKYAWMWKRAPNYFDVVAYTGTGSAGLTVGHNLGVAPEMMWIKRRDAAGNWMALFNMSGSSSDDMTVEGASTSNTRSYPNTFLNSSPTATEIILGSNPDVNNSSTSTHIAYLFASLAGVSKVGSYTGTGSTQTIDCGFSSGARFVLIKCTNAAENWIFFDSERGIVSGNDPYLSLNTTDAEITTQDLIDPVSSGFAVNTNAGEVNNSSNTYIFYAIA